MTPLVCTPSKLISRSAFIFVVLFDTAAFGANCITVGEGRSVTLTGTLDHQIFPGPPNYEDVTTGDVPEPTFILNFDQPICFTGDPELADLGEISRAHIFVAIDQTKPLLAALRTMIGRNVIVSGREPFPAITGHHHGPVVMAIDSVSGWNDDPTWTYGTAATTVQAFYQALAAGDGDEASTFVIAEKRTKGPLSASSLTEFYRDLRTPLRLIDVSSDSEREFTVLYTYEMSTGSFCNGEATVKTMDVDGHNLISSITAKNGC